MPGRDPRGHGGRGVGGGVELRLSAGRGLQVAGVELGRHRRPGVHRQHPRLAHLPLQLLPASPEGQAEGAGGEAGGGGVRTPVVGGGGAAERGQRWQLGQHPRPVAVVASTQTRHVAATPGSRGFLRLTPYGTCGSPVHFSHVVTFTTTTTRHSSNNFKSRHFPRLGSKVRIHRFQFSVVKDIITAPGRGRS